MARRGSLPKDWDDRARQIGVRLQRARHELNLSQEDVAHRAGISSYTYQKFEKGESKPGTPMNPRLTTLLNLCDVLQVDLDQLVARSDHE